MQSFIFILAVSTASVGSGFQHGYNIAVLNAPEEIISSWIKSLNISYLDDDPKREFYWSVIASIYTVGGIVGGIISPLFIMMGGPRTGLIYNGFIAIVAGTLMFVTKLFSDPTFLLVGRCIAGVNCGINGALCTIYIIECSPLHLRGAIGSLYQLFLTFAILIAMVVGLEPVLGGKDVWEFLFLLIPIVAIIQVILLLFVPESPKYLYEKKQNEEKARRAIERLHPKNTDQEFASLKSAADAAKLEPKVTVKIFFSQKSYVKPLWLCLFLMIAQQLSGINAVMFYSTKIFQQADLSLLDSQLCTAAIGLVNFLATVVAVAVIDKSGRKPLLLWGFIIMTAMTALLMGMLYLTVDHEWARYVCVTAILIYTVAFAVGAGPIPWIFGSEVFLTNARPIAYSFIVPTGWFFNLVVALAFPTLQSLMGPMVFLIFIVCQVCSIVIIFFFVPETKNRSIEDVIKDFA